MDMDKLPRRKNGEGQTNRILVGLVCVGIVAVSLVMVLAAWFGFREIAAGMLFVYLVGGALSMIA